ncbi:hypothetical protein ACQP1P_14510 [Dactylosporangium sp. CA-052675]|uniref:hypothetical protein n=1 Tax=Dactylosporangium sp. CA-052675 TaxID=3239927 RepID=UPI003D8B8AE2
MLTELDAVAWPELTHAYGEADDVPDLLRRLATGDEEALHALCGNIWHQGTVYEATAPAVPFLIEVLDAPGADAAGVLRLLASIAEGSSYLAVHEHPRGAGEADEELAAELAWVAAARSAVTVGRPVYVRLLRAAPSEDTRAAAAYTLAALGTVHADSTHADSAHADSAHADSAHADTDGADTAALRERAAADPSPVVRASAILALRARGVLDPRALADPEPLPRVVAAMAHILAGDPGPAGILAADGPAVLRAVGRLPWDSDDPLAWVLSAAERDWPTQVRVLSAWLAHPDPMVRAGAAYAAEDPMRTWRAAAAALAPLLAARLDDPDPAVRFWAASHLAAAGRAAAGADALWAVLDRRPGLDATAARALTALAALRDPRADAYIARVLAAPAAPPPAALTGHERLSAFIAAANKRDPAVGRNRALREQMADAARPVPSLVFDLRPLQPALPRLGAWATATRAALLPAIARARPGFERDLLIATAARLHPAPAPAAPLVPVLRGCLGEEDPSTAAVEALGALGPAAAAAVPELTALLGHAELTIRLPAAAALARITGDPAPLLAEAAAALAGPRAWQRTEALFALPAAGRAAAGLAPDLRALFDDEDEWQSMRAAVAYWHATGDPAPVVPVLLRHATHSPRGLEAVRCLAEIGPAAAEALPVLVAAPAAPDRRPFNHDTWGHDDDLWLDACAAAVARISGGGAPA